jgi:hypothetical protein
MKHLVNARRAATDYYIIRAIILHEETRVEKPQSMILYNMLDTERVV